MTLRCRPLPVSDAGSGVRDRDEWEQQVDPNMSGASRAAIVSSSSPPRSSRCAAAGSQSGGRAAVLHEHRVPISMYVRSRSADGIPYRTMGRARPHRSGRRLESVRPARPIGIALVGTGPAPPAVALVVQAMRASPTPDVAAPPSSRARESMVLTPAWLKRPAQMSRGIVVSRKAPSSDPAKTVTTRRSGSSRSVSARKLNSTAVCSSLSTSPGASCRASRRKWCALCRDLVDILSAKARLRVDEAIPSGMGRRRANTGSAVASQTQ